MLQNLYNALRLNNYNAVNHFLGFVSIDEIDEWCETPLHKAVYHNCDPEIIKLLIERGANINAQNYEKETPLHFATTMNSPADIVKMLLKHGADPKLKNLYKQSPKDLANIGEQKGNIYLLSKYSIYKEKGIQL